MCRTIDKNIKILKKIEKLLKGYKNPEAVFEEIPKNKRHLIKGYQYKSRKAKMLMEEYGPDSDYDRIAMLNDPFGSRTRPTKSGYYVRSKAEEAIADEAFERGLFFLYEKDLTLETEKGPITILPDFTFFNIYTEGFVYLEHFGKVDSVEYAGKNMPRIADYMANGYELEKDLFITMEGENHRFTRKEIKKVLDKIEEQLQ
ncbi:MAG: hypothetical protein K6F82_02855 [Sphaerochaetaceae bacterium]|nr:hypothetical protein [Sphaerochaetaceae bacterium]